MFKDAKSAVITIVVVVAFVAFALFAIDRNNVNRLSKAHNAALASKQEAYALVKVRFDLVRTMGQILNEEGADDPFAHMVGSWDGGASVALTSDLYSRVDTQLDVLQKRLFGEQVYLRLAPYFEEVYRAERSLAPLVEQYNEKADFYNAVRASFPASLAASRRSMSALERFAIAAALKGRP